jgi:hypothetical protein
MPVKIPTPKAKRQRMSMLTRLSSWSRAEAGADEMAVSAVVDDIFQLFLGLN